MVLSPCPYCGYRSAIHQKEPTMRNRLTIAALLIVAAASRALAADSAEITLLNGDDAKKALIDDAAEPYFSRMQPGEMEMKTGKPLPAGTLDAQRDECRKRYQAAVTDFTPEEETFLADTIDVARNLTTDYPLYHDLPWRFIKTDGTIEGSLPFTRGGAIVISRQFLLAGLNLGPKFFAHILIHEQSHVLQRKYPRLMADLYTSVWHFEKIDPIALDPALAATHVFNPDGTDVTWAYPIGNPADNKFILPLIVARKPATANWNMLRDMNMVAVPLTRKDNVFTPELDADKKTKVVDLSTCRDYIKQFPVGGDNYHPNEIAAESFALIVLAQDKVPERWKPEQAWFKVHLQSAPK